MSMRLRVVAADGTEHGVEDFGAARIGVKTTFDVSDMHLSWQFKELAFAR